MVASTPEAFAAAVAAYAFPDVALAAAMVERAEASLTGTGMVIVGERHGIADTPSVVYALVHALGVRAVAFEWSYEEVDDALQAFMRVGRFDYERLWTLPQSSEFFCGDGRITAGHFALLQRLHEEGVLGQVIAFDRLDRVPPRDWETHIRVREPELAARLLATWNRELRLLVLTGGFHARLESPDGAPMAAYLAKELPGLQPITLEHSDTTPAVVPGQTERTGV
jgi:hypothetical protein